MIGPFDVTLRSVEDWDYWCRCAFAGVYFHFDSSPEAFALVRTHEGSMSRNKATMLEAARKVRYKIMGYIRLYPDPAIAKEFLDLNTAQTAFTVKHLIDYYKQTGQKWNQFRRLFEFARLKGEYRYFIREGLSLLTRTR
jgi:hypothetical protein